MKHGAFIFTNLLFQTYSAISILTKTSNLITFFFQNYFRDYWNVFDFIVVLGGLLDVIVTVISQSVSKGRQGTGGARAQVCKELMVWLPWPQADHPLFV